MEREEDEAEVRCVGVGGLKRDKEGDKVSGMRRGIKWKEEGNKVSR